MTTAKRVASLPPVRANTTAHATQATEYAAWADGYDAPWVSTCDPAGRGRSNPAVAMSTASQVSRNETGSTAAST